MIAFDKSGKAISQCVKILCAGKEYTAEQLRSILKEFEVKGEGMINKSDLINLINSNDLPGDLTEIYDNLCNNFGLMSREDQESAEVRELREYIGELEEIVNEFFREKGVILP